MRNTLIDLFPIAATAAAVLLGGGNATASSHREAPFLTENPKVDGTDFYMFRSYEAGREANVTFVANYLPLQDPYGGPNFFSLDPDALYEILIDNNGDGTEDITFQFDFDVELRNLTLPVGTAASRKTNSVWIYNLGPIPSGMADPTANQNIIETYSMNVVRGPRRTGATSQITAMGGGATFSKPADFVGEKTSPDYATYAATHIHTITIPGCAQPGKVFVGQRKDPFVVNLGEIFDLINISLPDISGASMCDSTQTSRDNLKFKNVTTIALEVPTACLTQGADPVIGAWTTASLRQARAINPKATFDLPAKEGGPWAQVSRLGHPLINEVIIGLIDKNRFNTSHPTEDATLFLDYVTHPTLPKIVGIVYMGAVGANLEPQIFPRQDLIDVFLAGLDGVTKPTTPGALPSEQLRLNTMLATTNLMTASTLGVVGGDTAGFPNGRRLFDDVVDIELRVAMGALLPEGPNNPAKNIPITDCAPTNVGDYDVTFPYVKPPLPGSVVP